MRETLMTELTAIELRVDETSHLDDASFIPLDYRGPVFLAVAHANRIVSLTEHGRVVRPLPVDLAAGLIHAAGLARREEIDLGVDTANGRTITTLRIRIDDPRGAADSYSFTARVNHCAPRALPRRWSALLVGLRDAIGELGTADAACWDRALTWAGPVDLGPAWRRRAAVRLPHLVTCVEPDGPLFIRTGQPTAPGAPYRARPSVLYRLDPPLFGHSSAVTLTCPDDGSVVAPDDTRLRWQLPCGGGVVMYHHEWQQPPRVVIRVDDLERGIYVQRDPRQ